SDLGEPLVELHPEPREAVGRLLVRFVAVGDGRHGFAAHQPDALLDDVPLDRGIPLLPKFRHQLLDLPAVQHPAEQVFRAGKLAAFQEHHGEARPGQGPRRRRAGRSGADADRVDFFVYDRAPSRSWAAAPPAMAPYAARPAA